MVRRCGELGIIHNMRCGELGIIHNMSRQRLCSREILVKTKNICMKLDFIVHSPSIYKLNRKGLHHSYVIHFSPKALWKSGFLLKLYGKVEFLRTCRFSHFR